MTSASILKTLKLTRAVGESTLTAEISPCSWMYPGYGLQICATLNGRGDALVVNKSLSFTEAREVDAQALLDSVGLTSSPPSSRWLAAEGGKGGDSYS